MLVRWHRDDPASRKQHQLGALHEFCEIISDADAELLLELLIHPRPPKTAGTKMAPAWEDTVLPDLQQTAVAEIQDSGIFPVLWKIEGHSNAKEAARLDALVGSARPDASVLILGGGSDVTGLREAFSCRAGNERFRGFAVGRSIWQAPISALCLGEVTQAAAQRAISDNFLAVIEAFESADRVTVEPC